MAKKLTVGLLIAAVAITLILSTAVMAQERDATLEALYEQIYELQRLVVERRVELGDLSEEEGNRMLEYMEEGYLNRFDQDSGRSFGSRGMMGWGGGFGHCWRY